MFKEILALLRWAGVFGLNISGGGGGGGTQQSTSYTTNVPEYAKQPFMDMVGKATALSEAPYQAYGGERVAGFNPLQQQSFQNAQGQQVAGQIGAGSGIAGAASLQALGAAGYNPQQVQGAQLSNFMMGPAQQVGTQSFLQGNNAAAYMSPYMQQVVDMQKREAIRDDAIMRQSRQAQAVNAGAFGGSRQAIMEAEAQRNLGTRLGDIQATGLQGAFQNAQQQFNQEQGLGLQAQTANQGAGLTTGQANLQSLLGVQQLGANQFLQAQGMNQQAGLDAARLGLQGSQTALQGAGVLGQLGQQQFGQQMDITGMQNQLGGQQQQQQQRILDQQYADFQNQRDFPYQQLGFLSDILRGTGSSTRSIYATPQPSGLQTLAGLGTAGAGLFGMKEGGSVPGYALGGGIAGALGDPALQQRAQSAPTPMGQMAAQNELAERAQLRAAAPQGLPMPQGGGQEQPQPLEILMAELEKAVAEGDTQKAQVLSDIIAEQMDPASTGLAAAAPEGVGEFAAGGVVGYEDGGRVVLPANRPSWEAELLRLQNPDLDVRSENDGSVWRGLKRAFLYNSDIENARKNEEKAAGIASLAQPAIAAPGPGARARSTPPQGIAAAPAPTPAPAAPPTPRPKGTGLAGASAATSSASSARAAGPNMDPLKDEYKRLQDMVGQAEGADREALQAQMADLEQRIKDRGPLQEERLQRLQGQEKEIDGKKGKAKNMALIEAGLAILSADPSRGAFSAIGEGALKGVKAYKGDIAALEEKREAIFEKMDQIAELRRQQAEADGKEKAQITGQIRGLRGAAIRESAGLIREVGIPIQQAEVRMAFEAAENQRNRENSIRSAQISSAGRSNNVLEVAQAYADSAKIPLHEAIIQVQGRNPDKFDVRQSYTQYLNAFKPDPLNPVYKPMSFAEYARMFPPAPVSSAPPQNATVRP